MPVYAMHVGGILTCSDDVTNTRVTQIAERGDVLRAGRDIIDYWNNIYSMYNVKRQHLYNLQEDVKHMNEISKTRIKRMNR
jgi:hypothetical protein